MWTQIILSLVRSLAPLFEEWILNWLESRLLAVAPVASPASVGALDDKAAKLHLLQRVRDELWFFQFAKKSAVDSAIAQVKGK